MKRDTRSVDTPLEVQLEINAMEETQDNIRFTRDSEIDSQL